MKMNYLSCELNNGQNFIQFNNDIKFYEIYDIRGMHEEKAYYSGKTKNKIIGNYAQYISYEYLIFKKYTEIKE